MRGQRSLIFRPPSLSINITKMQIIQTGGIVISGKAAFRSSGRPLLARRQKEAPPPKAPPSATETSATSPKRLTEGPYRI